MFDPEYDPLEFLRKLREEKDIFVNRDVAKSPSPDFLERFNPENLLHPDLREVLTQAELHQEGLKFLVFGYPGCTTSYFANPIEKNLHYTYEDYLYIVRLPVVPSTPLLGFALYGDQITAKEIWRGKVKIHHTPTYNDSLEITSINRRIVDEKEFLEVGPEIACVANQVFFSLQEMKR